MNTSIMSKPLAKVFLNVITIMQDCSHNKEKMEFVIKKLENVYDIKITVKNTKYLNYVISGNLNLKNSPEETLDVVMSLVIPDYKPNKHKLYSISVNR